MAEIVYNKRFTITAFQYCSKKKKKKRNSRQERKRGLPEAAGPKDRQAAVCVKGL